jgi:hypothetical protein
VLSLNVQDLHGRRLVASAELVSSNALPHAIPQPQGTVAQEFELLTTYHISTETAAQWLTCSSACSAVASGAAAEDIERLTVGRARRRSSSSSQAPPLHFSDAAMGYLRRLAQAAAHDAVHATSTDGEQHDQEVGPAVSTASFRSPRMCFTLMQSLPAMLTLILVLISTHPLCTSHAHHIQVHVGIARQGPNPAVIPCNTAGVCLSD